MNVNEGGHKSANGEGDVGNDVNSCDSEKPNSTTW